jgi:hypothetical protein
MGQHDKRDSLQQNLRLRSFKGGLRPVMDAQGLARIGYQGFRPAAAW